MPLNNQIIVPKYISGLDKFQETILTPQEIGAYSGNNPSGFITGIDLSSYATVINLNNTGSTLNIKIDSVSGYLQNQINNISGGGGSGVTGDYYPNSNPSGFITGVDLSNYYTKDNPSGFITSHNVVFTTGDQNISGLKDFTTRPTVNTVPVALSGEASSNIEQWVKNDYGATLYKGQPVYVSGSNGNNILIHPASNSGEPTSSKTFGLLKQTLLNNGQGYVVTEGPLLNVDTSMATEGDPIWLGPTGNLIFGLANKPKAPQHLVYLGFVERAHQNQGKIFVKVQNGFELEELHDVRIINPQNNDIIQYNSGSGLWLNSSSNFYTKDNPSGFITGIDLSNYATITNLAITGSTLQTSINNVALNLATTGSNLNIQINNLSGTLTGNYATNLNLQSTGQNLNQKIDNLSGYSTGTFATINNLNLTGSTLQQNINIVSGNLGVTGQNLQSQIDDLSVKSIAYAIALG